MYPTKKKAESKSQTCVSDLFFIRTVQPSSKEHGPCDEIKIYSRRLEITQGTNHIFEASANTLHFME